MCGEHRKADARSAVLRGIIPACAGSTVDFLLTKLALRDHPRMCGEHQKRPQGRLEKLGIIPACAGSTMLPKSFWMPPTGSSPHVRGALSEHLGERRVLGIIPACAGSTGLSGCL